MTIAILTAGTGSYYCGACMRDNALARELIGLGHEVQLLPVYLPLQLDEAQVGESETPIFFGGINLWLQQKFALFRRTPDWLDRLLNRRSLLRAVAKRSHLTSPREQGEITAQMLDWQSNQLDKELEKLIAWLEQSGPPEVIVLSNALLSGFIFPLRERFQIPVGCMFQGEDSFLDSLPAPWRKKCWGLLQERLKEASFLISPSQFYADLMRERLKQELVIEVIPNGIDAHDFQPSQGPEKVIGYFARLSEEKGLRVFVEAFIELKDSTVRAKIGGTMVGRDPELVTELQEQLAKSGLADQVSWHPELTREEKIAFFQSLSLFSVPAIYPEAFGLYVLEAMAAGVPLVQPRASAFPEILSQSESGILVEPKNPKALAEAWRQLLANLQQAADLGARGRAAAEGFFSLQQMGKNYAQVFQKACESADGANQLSHS